MVERTYHLTPTLLAEIEQQAGRHNMTMAEVLRTAATLGLRELARRPIARTPSTPRISARNKCDPDPRLEEVWRVIAERRLRQRAGKVNNVAAWRRKVASNARADHYQEARRLCRTYPDLRVEDLARVLEGCVDLLRFERRRSDG